MSSTERSRVRGALFFREGKPTSNHIFIFFPFYGFFVLWRLTPRYRITIGNKSCDFGKETDPTLLRAPSAGKLLQYMVEDRGHISVGHSYAEMEVTPALGGGGGGF